MTEGPSQCISLSLPSDLRYLEAVRAMVDALTRRLELETRTVGLSSYVVSAFNEAFNNIVEHAYDGEPTGLVRFDVTITPARLILSLVDRGNSFDLDDIETPDLEAMPERGLGLVIIRSVMSRVSYDCSEGRNTLTMEKDFERPLVMADGRFGSNEG